jgi:PAS domain S-box-containing protein
LLVACINRPSTARQRWQPFHSIGIVRDIVKTNTATIVILSLIVLILVGSSAFMMGEQWRLLSQQVDSEAQAESLAEFRQSLMLLGTVGAAVLAGTLLVIVRLRRNSASLEQRVHERTAALEHEQYLLQALLQHLPHSIYFKDADSRFVSVSRALVVKFGLHEAGQVLGKTDFDFFSEEHARQAFIDEQELLRGAKSVIEKHEVETWPDGSKTWCATTKLPLVDGQGRTIGTFGISQNITAQKQAEEALYVAKQAAETANRAKGDFLANVSHEIRTPMNAIIGMTELVLDTEITPVQRDYLSIVQQSGEALLSLINDILDFSKIEAGKLDLEKAPFDIHECLGDTMKSLSLRAARKGIELVCHIASNVPQSVAGDAARLRQVVVNLVGNALKFTETGEVVLSAVVESATAGEFVLHLSVRDTGIGIPQEKLTTIFAAFEQADSSVTRKYGGTGLGLAISSRLVDLMGGRIWVESQIGKGSTFHFTARLETAPAAATTRRDGSAAPILGTRVLIVDDNDTNLRLLAEMLTNWGMQPTTAPGAAQGLDRLQSANRSGQPFQLVLTDINMPLADGFSLIENMLGDKSLAATRVIVLTSGDRPGDISRSKQLAVAGYLVKPVKQSELFDAIVSALGVTDLDDAKDRPSGGAEASTGPLRILLAEDSIPNQKLALGLLTKWGHTLTVAGNGREAIAAWETQRFDLILMDVQMPELDGLQATLLIREKERGTGRHVPIIAMTAHAMKGDREECLAAGMDGYVPKPIRAHELSSALAELFCRPDEQPAASAAADGPQDHTSRINWSAALETVMGDRDLLKSVIDAVRVECPAMLEQLEQAVAQGDSAVVRRAAHTIKGSLRTFEATRAAGLAADIETAGRNADLESISGVVPELKLELAAVLQELAAFSVHTAATV